MYFSQFTLEGPPFYSGGIGSRKGPGMLILSRKVNESIMIGDQIAISVVEFKGDQVKLGIKAPKEVKVYRQEVYEAIQLENKAAARTGTTLPQIDSIIDSVSKKTE